MAIPSVNLFSNMPGGGINAAMNANNALANNMHLRELNRIKAKYAPLTTQAEAMSKLAYANLMAPQFLAKMMANPDLVASLSESDIKNNLNMIQRAGSGQGTGASLINSIQNGVAPNSQGIKNPLSNMGEFIADKFRNAFTSPPSPQDAPSSSNPAASQSVAPRTGKPKGAVRKVSEQWYDENGEPVYEDNMEGSQSSPLELEVTTGQAPGRELTYAEKAGRQRGIIKEGEKLGDYRAEDIRNTGNEQKSLAASGVVLDRLTNIVKSDEFQNARNTIPMFQDKQLSLLKIMGTPEQKDMIGDFLSTAEAYKAATVNSFAGKPLVREFDLADRIKISEGDPVGVAEGKIRSLTTLKKIAEQKNKIILRLMQDKHMNQGDAIEEANKRVDIKPIELEVTKLLEPRVSVTNQRTGEIIMMPRSKARELGVPNV